MAEIELARVRKAQVFLERAETLSCFHGYFVSLAEMS